MFCSDCGTNLDEDQIFCPNCGTRIEDEHLEVPGESPPTPGKIKFPSLGKVQLIVFVLFLVYIFGAVIAKKLGL